MAAPTKAVRPRGAAKKAAPFVPPHPDDVPEELRDFYGQPPELTKARGGGTTGPAEVDLNDLDFDTSTPVAPMAMEPLFKIDGVQYYIPVEFPPAYGVVYLDALESGRDTAVGKVLKLAVGKVGWTAFRNLAEERPDLITPQLLNAIMNKILTRVMGSLEDAGEGNG